jgi:hypothetical protein
VTSEGHMAEWPGAWDMMWGETEDQVAVGDSKLILLNKTSEKHELIF